MFDALALRVKGAEQVTDAYIRHYQGILVHVCRLVYSPSVLSLKPSAASVAHAAAAAEAEVYVAFAACGKFKLYFNGKFVLQSNSIFVQNAPNTSSFKLYGAHVAVSFGGVFAISLENGSSGAKESNVKGFVGCIGSSVCTGLNDGQGWSCTRERPAEGWMLPILPSRGADAATHEARNVSRAVWAPARSQGTTSSVQPFVEQGLDDRALWLWPDSRQAEEQPQVHCRWAL